MRYYFELLYTLIMLSRPPTQIHIHTPPLLLPGSMVRSARLWHLEYTHPLRVYAGHERDVDAVRFHPNCNYLATGSVDRTVRLWSHADAKMVS